MSNLATVFQKALGRGIQVAGEDEEGRPARTTYAKLEAATGVSRKTIADFCNGGAGRARLEEIERLAKGLGVPPAFLLMRPEDWQSLANAVNSLINLAKIDGEKPPPQQGSVKDSIRPLEAAEIGVTLGVALGAIPKRRSFDSLEQARAIRTAEKGVQRTAALPSYDALTSTNEKYAAIAICAFAGTPKTY